MRNICFGSFGSLSCRKKNILEEAIPLISSYLAPSQPLKFRRQDIPATQSEERFRDSRRTQWWLGGGIRAN